MGDVAVVFQVRGQAHRQYANEVAELGLPPNGIPGRDAIRQRRDRNSRHRCESSAYRGLAQQKNTLVNAPYAVVVNEVTVRASPESVAATEPVAIAAPFTDVSDASE